MEFVFSRSSEKQSEAHPPLDTEVGSKGQRKHFTNERPRRPGFCPRLENLGRARAGTHGAHLPKP